MYNVFIVSNLKGGIAMEFVKYESSDNDSVKIIHCSDCAKSCGDTNDQSLKEKRAKATGG